MPCNRYFEYILQQCKNVEELWPAIFFKAPLKLDLYKIGHPSYYYNEEFMDASVIYSLTGMQVIHNFYFSVKIGFLFDILWN